MEILDSVKGKKKMTLLVKQELFKLIKKKSTAVLSVLLVVLLIGTALLAKNTRRSLIQLK